MRHGHGRMYGAHRARALIKQASSNTAERSLLHPQHLISSSDTARTITRSFQASLEKATGGKVAKRIWRAWLSSALGALFGSDGIRIIYRA